MDELDLRICALIGEGMSQRKAAEACGVSRGKVIRAMERHRAEFGDKSGAAPVNEAPPAGEHTVDLRDTERRVVARMSPLYGMELIREQKRHPKRPGPVPFGRSGQHVPRDIRVAAYAAGKAAALAMQFATQAGFRLPKEVYRAWRAENMPAWRSKANIVKSHRPVASAEGRTC